MHNKNIIIGALLAIVLVMTVAFAAFSTSLTITDTASTAKKWEIKITSIEKTSGTATDVPYNATSATDGTRVVNDLSANFKAQFVSPGDSATYTVTVKNNGTLAAKVSNIAFTNGNTDAITNTYTGIAQNDTLAAGESTTFTVTTTYTSNVTSQPYVTKANCSITLTFIQNA